MLETDGSEEGGKSQSPLGNIKKKHQPTLTPRQSEKNLGISDLSKQAKTDKGSKLMKFGGLGKASHSHFDYKENGNNQKLLNSTI